MLESDIFTSNFLLTTFLACVVFVLLFWRKLFEKHRYPPGPIPLPLIGNDYYLFADARAAYKYKHWKKYGNVVSHVTFGSWSVDLYGFDVIHECFVKNGEHFSERSVALGKVFSTLGPGLIFGSRWKDLRRQALTVLRDHGMGKVKIEEKIREEFEYNVEVLTTMIGVQSSKAFTKTIGMCIGNIIGQVAFGRRLDYNDNILKTICDLDQYLRANFQASVIPFYKYLPWDPFKLEEHRKRFLSFISFIESEIQQHKKTLDVDQIRDHIDAYLAEGVKHADDPLFADEDCLMVTIVQLFLGGFDTTTSTLTWALLYLVNYPSAQRQIYDEIQQVIGNRPVTMADRDKMHFTHAFIQEVLRAGTIGLQALPHLCTKDTVIQGHNIPEGTTVWANIYSTHYDEQMYPNPHAFIPERFLDDEGVYVRPSGKQMLPFSIGKRVCPGESLARAEVFMIIVSFVQRFEVYRVSDEKLKEDGINIFSHSPKPFDFRLKLRN